MGSLLGARLSNSSASVTLFSTDREHMEAIRRDGLVIEELDGTARNYPLSAYYDPDGLPRNPDLALVMVKTYATQIAVSNVHGLCSPSTVFLTLQNGIGNWERIAEISGREAVLAGSTAQGATLLGPGMIRHGGNGPTYIGEPDGPVSERVRSIVELFRESGLKTEPSDNVERLIWEKLKGRIGEDVLAGVFPGGHLPPTNKCALMYGVAIPTLRKAVRALQAEGLLTGHGRHLVSARSRTARRIPRRHPARRRRAAHPDPVRRNATHSRSRRSPKAWKGESRLQ